MPKPSVVWDEATSRRVDGQLARLAAIDRSSVLRSGVRKAADVVKRAWAEKIPRGKKEPHLADLMTVKVIEYPNGNLVAIVGGDWHAGAKYLHLVEEGHELWFMGHKTNTRTRAGKYRDDAVDETESEVERTIGDEVERLVDKIMGAV